MSNQAITNKKENTLELIVNNSDKLAFAGKEPPQGVNWLDGLEVGVIFLCREKNTQNFVLPQFAITEKLEDNKGTLLQPFQPGDINTPLYVDNVRFCNRFSYVDTIGVYIEEEQKEEPLE